MAKIWLDNYLLAKWIMEWTYSTKTIFHYSEVEGTYQTLFLNKGVDNSLLLDRPLGT